MSEEMTLVPKLRFGEFAQEWTLSKLNSATKVTDCKHRTPEYVKSGIPIVSPGSIRWGKLDTVSPKKRVTETEYESLMDHCSPQINDMVFSRNQSLGVASRVTDLSPFVLGQDTVLISEKRDSLPFVYFQLQTTAVQNNITRLSGGSTFSRINLKDIRELNLKFPTLPEQEKIAAFLTSVDAQIEQLQRKKSLLQDYKKGVMQRLFSQQLRFKDQNGNNYPDWEEKKLGEIYSYITTNSLSRDKLNYDSGEVYNIHYGDIHTKFRSHFYLSKENVPYLNSSAEQLRIKDECYVKAGDIVLADASEDYADIGKSIEILDTEDQQIVAGLHTYILRPNLSQMAIGFGAYLMQARPTRLEVMMVAQGTKVLGLPKSYFSQITLKIPSPAEQTKIANFLSTLDTKIEQVTQQITQTQTFKKGLLQQMFV